MAINTKQAWTPDESQQQVINIRSGKHLVLAPPGCGKTQILAERIAIAMDEGVKPEDMLCLTFTNRAARGMRERINERVGEAETASVFVGNVHRFCSKFLYENGIVPAETAIIDDDDAVSILARYLDEDEEKVSRDYRRKKTYSQIIFFSHFMFDIEHGFPKPLRMHPECVTHEDIAVLKALCKVQGKPFDAKMMTDVYNHTDFYLDIINEPPFSPLLRHEAEQTLHKMRFAHAYVAYKQQNNLLDFEDLLQYTYAYLSTHDDYKRYPWVQVDEVQDLNLLQLEIIKSLSLALSKGEGNAEFYGGDDENGDAHTPSFGGGWGEALFFGDEQQAIFSFMGAKLATLNILKEECKGNIHHLNVNHRCPKPLLEMLNAYAVANLGSDPSLLPKTDDGIASPLPEGEGLGERSFEERSKAGYLFIKSYDNIWAEFKGVAKLAAKFEDSFTDSTTAIVVNSNHDADEISKALDANGHPHFKISGTDIFSTPEVKLLLAHLSVLNNDHNFLAWSRILHGLRVCETAASARQFVHQLRKRAITPSDFLHNNADVEDNLDNKNNFKYEDNFNNKNNEVKIKPNTYISRFVKTYETSDIVVFDTEATGLDVFNDDIIQIAAERIRQGKSIAKFSVYIETDKSIPTMLGDIVNPIIEERKHQHLYSHKEALQMFIDFVGTSPLLAHNANFDTHILHFNLKRYLGTDEFCNGSTTDSLKLIRLLRPDLKAFKLKLLLQELGLEGENSHLADDDVNATVSLVNYCYEKAKEILPSQQEYLGRKTTQDRIKRLKNNYADVYNKGIARLYQQNEKDTDNHAPALVDEMRNFYNGLIDGQWIKPIEKIDYIFRYLANDVIDETKEPSLVEQLDNHIMEINTFKEADLCGSSTITDRLFVSTIHKAKGLEFDNVLVFDVVDGRIPNYYNENNPAMLAEDARKLYVAMSRAKKRLYICYSKQGPSSGMPERKISRFLKPVTKYFKG